MYCYGMTVDIENATKNCVSMSWFSGNAARERIIYNEIPGKQWEVSNADIIYLYGKHYIHCRFS